MLKISDLDVDIGPTPILRGVTLEVPPGKMYGLIGRNGAGKTTFMRTVMGILAPRAGKIVLESQDITAVEGHRRAHLGVGYMPEDRRLIPDLTAEENVMLPVWSTNMPDAAKRLAWIYGLMPEVEEFRGRGALELSGGQQKFVAFARALMAGTRLLLLDEPLEGIAPIFIHRMLEILGDLKDEGISVLIAESNDTHIAPVIDFAYTYRARLHPDRLISLAGHTP